MSLGRRGVRLDDSTRWVFNRMADVYDARPDYPAALIEVIASLADSVAAKETTGSATVRGCITEIGAGIGHIAVPLASLGFDVSAVEPAIEMLQRLRAVANERGVVVNALHASAEALPIADGTQDLAIVADALHFLDAERTGREIARVLTKTGAFALITCELADTPYMREVVSIMEDAVPRRPRPLAQNVVQVSAMIGVELSPEQRFADETVVDHQTLERILRSISFIGPAMNPARFAAFRERVHAIPGQPRWARAFTLRTGQRRPSRRAQLRAARDEARLASR